MITLVLVLRHSIESRFNEIFINARDPYGIFGYIVIIQLHYDNSKEERVELKNL